METVVFSLGGSRELEVCPDMVCSATPYEMKADRMTVLNIFGQLTRVPVSIDTVRKALGWDASQRIGFDGPESAEVVSDPKITEPDKKPPAKPDKAPTGEPPGDNGKATKQEGK